MSRISKIQIIRVLMLWLTGSSSPVAEYLMNVMRISIWFLENGNLPQKNFPNSRSISGEIVYSNHRTTLTRIQNRHTNSYRQYFFGGEDIETIIVDSIFL
ncbi:MAG: hypothetical protein LBQ66_07790 [Planctomycetaceae bacterium]|nr:hypothetical protein [Planctomycetaceae bacterium]